MLEVSRPGISVDEIMPFSVEERFIKLPIENYLNILGIELNRPQIAIVNCLNSPKYRFVTACIARRVGKTYIGNIVGQLIALQPGTTILIVAPDYALTTISWDLQRELLDQFDVEKLKDNAKDRVIQLINGSMIRVCAVSKIDSAVGRSYDYIIFDEAAIKDEGGEGFSKVLMPTLDKVLSKVLFISTPRGDNWFKEYYDRGFSDQYPEWASVHADWRENPRASEKIIQQAKNTMSKNEFKQEHEALFVTFEGQIWDFLEEDICDLTDLRFRIKESPERYDIIAGLDIGFRDDTAYCVVVPIDLEDDLTEYNIIAEYLDKEQTTEKHAEHIFSMDEHWGVDITYIDSAAAQTKHDLAVLYDISTVNAVKSLLDGIGLVASLCDNHRIKIDSSCVECIFAMQNYKWNEKTEIQKPARTRARNMADAIRYAIYSYESGQGGVY